MKSSTGASNGLITVLALVLIVLVVGAIVLLATQTNLFSGATPAPATGQPVLVTRVVPGQDLTPRAFPTLPPAWTETTVPSATATVPTRTPSQTSTLTITPTFPPTNTPAPTVTGPTPTRRPTLTPSMTPTLTPTMTHTRDTPAPTGTETPQP